MPIAIKIQPKVVRIKFPCLLNDSDMNVALFMHDSTRGTYVGTKSDNSLGMTTDHKYINYAKDYWVKFEGKVTLSNES